MAEGGSGSCWQRGLAANRQATGNLTGNLRSRRGRQQVETVVRWLAGSPVGDGTPPLPHGPWMGSCPRWRRRGRLRGSRKNPSRQLARPGHRRPWSVDGEGVPDGPGAATAPADARFANRRRLPFSGGRGVCRAPSSPGVEQAASTGTAVRAWALSPADARSLAARLPRIATAGDPLPQQREDRGVDHNPQSNASQDLRRCVITHLDP